MGRTIHLGIASVPSAEATTLDLARDRNFLTDLATLGFDIDGDSFGEWGETLRDESLEFSPIPLHVTWSTDSPRDARRDVRTVRDALSAYLATGFSFSDFRLADYAVVTDRDDWSEDVEIVTAFDGIASKVAR